MREGTILHCCDASTDDRVDLDACRRVGAMCMVCVPLIHAGRVTGVLKVYDRRPNAFSQSDVGTLDLLSGVIGAHMAHATDFQEHHHDSRHDALTGLPNRRAFDERLDSELARVRRHGGEFAVCLLDLDRFKQVNDTDGHAAGDAVLRAVAKYLSQMRGEDAAYRVGGYEFALTLVEASADGGATVIERITTAIRQDPDCRGVSASCGVAAFEIHDDAASLVSRADVALYDVKRCAGRMPSRAGALST